MFSLSQSIRVGLFFIFGLLLIWTLRESLSGGDSFMGEDGYSLIAHFNDLQQLTVGDEIRLAGIRVGQVRNLQLINGHAEVQLHIFKTINIPEHSVATITTAGLLGNNYISIRPSQESRFYAPNSVIESQHSADFNEVIRSLGAFGNKLSKGLDALLGNDQEPGLFTNLNRLLLDNKTSIEKILHNFENISTKINEGDGTLSLLVNNRSLYDELLKAIQGIQNLGSLAEDGRNLVADVRKGKGALGVLLQDEEAAKSLKNTLHQLDEFTERLARENTTLGKLVSDDSLYQKAEQVLNRADSALSNMTDSAPLSAVGVAATALF